MAVMDEFKEEREALRNGTPKEKLSYFWYYYKWHTLIGAFVILIAIVLIAQFSGRESYDMQVLYAGPHIFQTGEKEAIQSAFSQLLKQDYNEDGKKNCDIMDMCVLRRT